MLVFLSSFYLPRNLLNRPQYTCLPLICQRPSCSAIAFWHKQHKTPFFQVKVVNLNIYTSCNLINFFGYFFSYDTCALYSTARQVGIASKGLSINIDSNRLPNPRTSTNVPAILHWPIPTLKLNIYATYPPIS